MNLIKNLFAAGSGSTGISDLRNPALWLTDSLAGRRTTAGVHVNAVSALSIAPYYAAMRVISEDIGKLPMFVFEQLSPRGKKKAKNHHLFPLLHESPNSEMSSMSFRETLTSWALGWGNGYAENQMDDRGRTVALWPIHPSRVIPKRDNDGIFYEVRIRRGDITKQSKQSRDFMIILRDFEMFHIHGLGDNGLTGFSVLQIASESLGLALATQQFGASFFGNGSTLSGVLEHPEKLDNAARANLRESWDMMHQGSDKASRIGLLEEGLKYTQIGIPPEQAQFIATRNFQVEDIARWFRVAPHKIQHLLRSTFSNIEQQSIEYVTDTLMPWIIRWEHEVERKLLDGEPEELFVKIETNALLRGDSKARANFYKARFSVGSLSPNDIKELEDENPIDGGDEYFVMTNLTTLGKMSEQPVEPTPPPALPAPIEPDDESSDQNNIDYVNRVMDINRILLRDVIQRVTTKEEKALARAAKKYDCDLDAQIKWSEKFYTEQEGYMFESFLAIITSMESYTYSKCEAILNDKSISGSIKRFVKDYIHMAKWRVTDGKINNPKIDVESILNELSSSISYCMIQSLKAEGK